MALLPQTSARDSPAEQALQRELERRYAAVLSSCNSDSIARYKPYIFITKPQDLKVSEQRGLRSTIKHRSNP
jgi:hypothetical protein